MKNILLLTLMLIVLVGCNKKQASNETMESQAFQAERDIFFNSLKTTDEISPLVLSEAIKYDESLLNGPVNYTRYLNNQIKSAANMGIYIADLNYNLMFGASQSNMEYFKAAHELSKEIGIEQGILQFLMLRYSNNASVSDSVKVVVGELLNQSATRLKGTDRERLAGVAIVAYQIENLHLALGSIKPIPDNATEEHKMAFQQLSQYILAYRPNIEASYNFLHSYADPLDVQNNPDYPYIDNALRDLIAAYRTLEGKTLTSESIDTLKKLVDPIRTKVVN